METGWSLGESEDRVEEEREEIGEVVEVVEEGREVLWLETSK